MSVDNLKVGHAEIIPYEKKREAFLQGNRFQQSAMCSLAKGATGERVLDLQNYLRSLGYLQDEDKVNEGEFDAATVDALKHYQSFHKLTVTGDVDDATLKLLNSPRCGVPDVAPKSLASERRTLRNPWPKNNLTYYFRNLDTSPDINTIQEAAAAFQSGVSLWHAATPIRFKHTTVDTSANRADIVVLWGIPGCDGAACTDTPDVGATISRAYSLYWSAVTWVVNNPQADDYDMVAFAGHEFGHLFGLHWVINGETYWHSQDSEALMYASIPAGRRRLNADDIAAARRIFG